MSRAEEIVARYQADKNWAYHHTGEEILAMAYDELLEMLHREQDERRRAEEQLASMVHRTAMQVYQFKEVELQPLPHDIGWGLRLHPVDYELRMLTAPPEKWEPRVLEAVAKSGGDAIAMMLAKALFGRRAAQKAAKE